MKIPHSNASQITHEEKLLSFRIYWFNFKKSHCINKKNFLLGAACVEFPSWTSLQPGEFAICKWKAFLKFHLFRMRVRKLDKGERLGAEGAGYLSNNPLKTLEN